MPNCGHLRLFIGRRQIGNVVVGCCVGKLLKTLRLSTRFCVPRWRSHLDAIHTDLICGVDYFLIAFAAGYSEIAFGRSCLSERRKSQSLFLAALLKLLLRRRRCCLDSPPSPFFLSRQNRIKFLQNILTNLHFLVLFWFSLK